MEDYEKSLSLMELEIKGLEKDIRILSKRKETKLLLIEDLRELMSKVAEESSFYRQIEENKSKLRINDVLKIKEKSLNNPRKYSEDTVLSKIHSVSTVDSNIHVNDNC